MACEKFGYEFSWIISLLCCLYAYASTIKASRDIENVPAFVGGDLTYAWTINTQNLSRIVLFLNSTQVLSSKKRIFPRTSCTFLTSKEILDLCKNKIKPYSSVKDGKFNLVINRITGKYLDKSVWKLLLDYPKTQNYSSSIRIMLKETSAPTTGRPTGCKPCPPTPACPPSSPTTGGPTGDKACPPTPACPPSSPCPTPSSDSGWMIGFFLLVACNAVVVIAIIIFKCKSVNSDEDSNEEPSHSVKYVKNVKNYIKETIEETVKRRTRRPNQ